MIMTQKDAMHTENGDDLLEKAVKNVESWFGDYNEHIWRARNTREFLYVDQWDLNVKKERTLNGRPTLEFNKLTTIIRSILGEQRDKTPDFSVRGLKSWIPQSEIDWRSDLLREISYESRSHIAYQMAFKQALEGGWSALMVMPEYADAWSFDQVLRISSFPNIESVFFDPAAKEVGRQDGDFCGYYEVISLADFKRLYPEVENPQSAPSDYGIFEWQTRETITVCMYFYKKYKRKTLVQLSDGRILEKSEAQKIIDIQVEQLAQNPEILAMGFEQLEILNQKTVLDYQVCYIKFSRHNILEKGVVPGRRLPIVYVDGDSTNLQGRTIPLSYIEDAIDTQKLINYVGSEMAYAIMRARKETIQATPAQMKGFDQEYRNPDQVLGALPFNPDPKNPGPPHIVQPPVFSSDLMNVYQSSAQDLAQITGRYEEARGQGSNAISRVAIAERREASRMPVNVYESNLARAIQEIGRICLGMVPDLYDTETEVVTRDKKGQQNFTTLNKPSENAWNYEDDDWSNEKLENDAKINEFDVEVRVDASYDLQKEKAMRTLLELVAMNPNELVPLLGDKIAEVSGLENAEEVVQRLQTLVPPAVLAEEEGNPPPPPPQMPPDPTIVAAEIEKQKLAQRAESDEMKYALKARELMQNQAKIELDAKEKGIKNITTLAKTRAEIQKANDATLTDFIKK